MDLPDEHVLHQMSSPSLLPQSDDELFNPRHRPSDYETVETVPVNRIPDSPEHDTLFSLPALPQGQNTQRGGYESQSQYGNTSTSRHFTQPTQLLERSPSDLSSPPTKPTVQVAASSPIPTPVPPQRRTGILASAMAPAGTIFRRPYVPPAIKDRKPIQISSDDDGVESDESDRAEQARSNIKTSTFVRRSAAEQVPESPQNEGGISRFKQLTQGSLYRPTDYTHGIKRSSDSMAMSYGGAAKRPKQNAPSRAFPVQAQARQEEEDVDIDSISDFNTRSKVRRMRSVVTGHSVRTILNALNAKKGNYDDAADYLLLLSETKGKPGNAAIDLTGASEDELLKTPAANAKSTQSRAPVALEAKQQAKKPAKTIQEKWSSTQAAVRKPSIQNKKLDIFEDPGPAQPKVRKLIRGSRNKSPSTDSASSRVVSQDQKALPILINDDSEEEARSGLPSEEEDGDFDDRLLKFFNTCTAMDLADTASITREIAEHFVSQRPFRSIATVNKVENPNLKPTKTKRKPAPLGERIVEKVEVMLHSYEAVDYLVKKCEAIAKPLTAEMKNWGVDIYGKAGNGELDMTNLLPESQRSGGSHDSGIGTPVSDDDPDAIRGSVSKKLIGQPVSLAEDVVMKDYQIVGVNWLNLLFRKDYSCILADDMGLGKTLQTIAFLAHLAETGISGPHLIVVPAATLENWLKEFHRFAPGLAVEPYYAPNPGEREELRYHLEEVRDEINVVVTTYTIAKAKDDFPWLRNFGFICTIFDEGHALKNAESKVSKNLMRINAQWRLLLTGTPLQNNLKELMSLLFFLMPKVFKQKQEELEVIFKQDVKTITDDSDSREMLLSKERIARARSMLTPFILRRKKWQVLKDLPKKERKVEYCDMIPEQIEIYSGWVAKALDIRERRNRGERIPGDETANILMKLRQAAIHPLLFRHNYENSTLKRIAKSCLKDPMWEQSNPDLIFEELQAYSDFEVHQLCAKSAPLRKFMLDPSVLDLSGKVQAMIRLLKQFISEGHRTLIFSQFVMVLDILELVLNEHGIKFFRLDGMTKVSERQDLIDEFNEEVDEAASDASKQKEVQVPVFMLSTKAGGAGINLASASRVIIFDSGFNPQDDVQAENRAHRIGQKKEVEVWRLVTKNSVEEQIYGMGIVKLRLDREVAGEAADPVEDSGGKTKDGQVDEKEIEGFKTVEEMFFKNLETGQVKPESTASRNAKDDQKTISEVKEDEAVGDKEESAKPDTTNLSNKEKLDSEEGYIETDVQQQSDEHPVIKQELNNKATQPTIPSNQNNDHGATAFTRLMHRPKMGSRKNSSRSGSQKSKA